MLSHSPCILYRFWVSFWGVGFNQDDHWNLVCDGFCENLKNDLLWLIILRAIKVCDSLKHWGGTLTPINVPSVVGRKQLTIVSLIVPVVKTFGFISSLVPGFLPNCLFVIFFQWNSVDSEMLVWCGT